MAKQALRQPELHLLSHAAQKSEKHTPHKTLQLLVRQGPVQGHCPQQHCPSLPLRSQRQPPRSSRQEVWIGDRWAKDTSWGRHDELELGSQQPSSRQIS